MRRRLWTAMLVATLAAGAALGAAQPEPAAKAKGVPGKVVAVTLYRTQATVTRTVPVEAAAGPVELLVSGLPLHTVPESLFAEAGPGIEVRAVRFRTRAVPREPRPEVRKLDDEIEGVEQKIATNKKTQELAQQEIAYLGKLESFAAPTAKVELTQGVLDVDTLTKLTQFSFEQRRKIAAEALALGTEARSLAKQLSVLQRERGKLTHEETTHAEREAIVFLEKRDAAKAQLRLSYLVAEAGWEPAYNFRANDDRTKVAVEYNAVIRQKSGEDWNGVHLTLSTASPALSAEGPGLAPFRVTLARGAAPTQKEQAQILSRARDSRGRLRAAYQEQRKAQGLQPNRDANWEMNAAANDFQCSELAVDADTFQAMAADTRAEGPAVAYTLDAPVSLASRADPQMLRILDSTLATSFYAVATPILTSYVYREAKVVNTGADVLLAGPVSVYLDGRFVGRGEVPTVARGESFVMGFGVDPQLRARRERVARTERVQGGNREIVVKYRITLENFKDQPATVRVLDRRPTTDRDADIRVTLDDMPVDKLSTDPLYERLEKPKGILRWDIAVPAGAAGEKARILQYGYTVEFDRNFALAPPAGAKANAMQREFHELQKGRQNR